ncbi:competence protein [Sporolactobacillus sp. THM7-4]|nr:competence protein [Sporolactobacillus sp. THM7-4]
MIKGRLNPEGKGCDQMLTAVLDDGRLISLVSPEFSRTELNFLRQNGKFFCPVCHSPVLLKLGTRKRWHFSHKPENPCLIESEPESAIHLAGKEDLFLWTSQNGRSPLLEHYLPSIHQRADLFLPGIEPIAFEYQCSTLPEKKMAERTDGYQRMGINPVWILGSTRFRKKGSLLKIAGFETEAIRYMPQQSSARFPFFSPYYLCYYQPGERRFCFAAQLYPATETLFITREINQPLQKIKPYQIIFPTFPVNQSSFKQQWLKLKKHQRLTPFVHGSETEYRLRIYAYRMKKNLTYFPAFVGLPHEDYVHLLSPPYLWQMWVCLIFQSQPGKRLFVENIIHGIENRGAGAIFTKRNLPLCPQRSLNQMIRIYLNQLVFLRVLEKSEEGYRMHKSYLMRKEDSLERLLYEDQKVLDQLEKAYLI